MYRKTLRSFSSDSLSVETRAASGFCGCWSQREEKEAAAEVGGLCAGTRLRGRHHSPGGKPTSCSARPVCTKHDWKYCETQPAPPPPPAQFLRSTERGSGGDTALWLAYCWFHNGDYARARKVMFEGQRCPQFQALCRSMSR